MHSMYSPQDTAITEKVLFIDYDQCLSDENVETLTSISSDKEVIIEKSFPTDLDKIRYVFFLIDDFHIDSFNWLESMLAEVKDRNTYRMIMTKAAPTRSLFQFFAQELSGIVSLDYFLQQSDRVLETLDEYGVFLEQSLHCDLVTELHRKKLKDRPIKRLVLRTEDVQYILTENEKKVLQNILDGHNNRKIAEIMFLAPSTISTVISHLLKKLGANDRTDAMVQIIRRGWVDAVR
ncbi:hypothetical protein CR194_14140 [Salipaludibacillus keqinensis]|uniref:HTH luxR-type domain-containing protein n=1 Tax=Salipaludibacillus keqinensis TaxID=2045207 RepID=A0A323TCN2_9BACI|nr:LuxR C-terminal-related transcriptional regulator [Salipaludibacillus keqinensis]PYZ92789.1 hypothetical protein CR194_14140 [Salipaludibacillus keqinensis]